MNEGTMSEHAWVQEHVAAYLAGGLDAQEAERLEAHARECPACGAALADSRRLDDCLSNLFVGAHPALELEDRAVARLRTATPHRLAFNRPVKWAGAVAAVLLLAAIGAVAGSLESGESLWSRRLDTTESPFAGRVSETAQEKKSTEAMGYHRDLSRGSMLGYDLQYLEMPPVMDPLDKQTVDAVVSMDNVGTPDAPNTDTTALAARGIKTTNGPLHHSFTASHGAYKNTPPGANWYALFDPTQKSPRRVGRSYICPAEAGTRQAGPDTAARHCTRPEAGDRRSGEG